MLFEHNSPGISVKIGTSRIEQSDKEKLLGITLDKNLDFNCHVEEICKKLAKTSCTCASCKIHGPWKVANSNECFYNVSI